MSNNNDNRHDNMQPKCVELAKEEHSHSLKTIFFAKNMENLMFHS